VDTSAWIEEVRRIVNARLEAFFESKRAEAEQLSPISSELVDAVEALTMRGGKRLRPVVLTAGYQAVTPEGAEIEATANASAALELLQSYLLIHDDWMDGDTERRGGPSVHAAFSDHGHEPHLAESLGVLAGDLGSAYAWELLLQAPWPEDRRLDAHRSFVRIQTEVLFGQQLDLTGHPDVSRMHQLKTGSYTVRGPLRLGALLGNATEPQLEALERFGSPLGEAFQLRDDLLGTFGDSKETGKPAGNDLRAGKRTSLIAEAENVLSQSERAPLDAVLGHGDASDEAVSRATELLVTCGARARVEQRLDALLSEARGVLGDAAFAADGVERLQAVADKLAVRST
jgi:geranylgeranyl diphosphate synthase type I